MQHDLRHHHPHQKRMHATPEFRIQQTRDMSTRYRKKRPIRKELTGHQRIKEKKERKKVRRMWRDDREGARLKNDHTVNDNQGEMLVIRTRLWNMLTID